MKNLLIHSGKQIVVPVMLCLWVIGSSISWAADIKDVEKILGVAGQMQ